MHFPDLDLLQFVPSHQHLLSGSPHRGDKHRHTTFSDYFSQMGIVESGVFDMAPLDPGNSSWSQKEWFADLLALLVEEPLELPLLCNLLVLEVLLQLYAWKLSSICSQGWLFERGCRGHCFGPQKTHGMSLPRKLV